MLNNQEKPIPLLIKDLGMRFPKETSKRKQRYGKYKCNCGNLFISISSDVKAKKTSSCGCYKMKMTKIVNTKHGLRNHPIYRVWANMISRCYNKNVPEHKYYGGRGIKVCDSWRKFENFKDDMFLTFKKELTIDRIDNNGDYEPSNCRWVTMTTQNCNTRRIRATNTSGYRGVSYHKNQKKWNATISVNKKMYHIGSFENKLQAAEAYDKYVIDNGLEHTINGAIRQAVMTKYSNQPAISNEIKKMLGR